MKVNSLDNRFNIDKIEDENNYYNVTIGASNYCVIQDAKRMLPAVYLLVNFKNKKNEKFNYNILRKFNGFYGSMERSSYR